VFYPQTQLMHTAVQSVGAVAAAVARRDKTYRCFVIEERSESARWNGKRWTFLTIATASDGQLLPSNGRQSMSADAGVRSFVLRCEAKNAHVSVNRDIYN